MDKTERQQLSAIVDDVRRWVDESTSIRRIANTMPVSGRNYLPAQDDQLVSLVESKSTDLELAASLTRASFFGVRKKDPAILAAQRLTEAHRWVVSTHGSGGTRELLDRWSARWTSERLELGEAVQDLRHWRIQTADARRLAAHLPTSGPVSLEANEEELARLVENVRGDDEVAASLLGPSDSVPLIDLDATSSAARRVVAAHRGVVSSYGPERVDQFRQRYFDRAVAERKRLAQAVADLRPWTQQATEIRRLAEHLPISGPVSLEPAEQELVAVLERVRSEVDVAAKLIDAAESVATSEFGKVAGAAKNVTELHRRVVFFHGSGGVEKVYQRHVARAAEERMRLANAIGDVRRWAEHVAEGRETARHLPISGATVLGPQEEAMASTVELASSDIDTAMPLTRPLRWPSPLDFDAACGAANRVVHAYQHVVSTFKPDGPESLRWKYHHQAAAERKQVGVALRELAGLRALAERIIHTADHLPLSSSDVFDDALRGDLTGLVASYDQHRGPASRIAADEVCGTRECGENHAAADLIVRVHAVAVEDGLPDVVSAWSVELDARAVAERKQLSVLLEALSTIRHEGTQLADAAAHLPISRPGIVGETLSQTTAALIDQIARRWRDAERLAVDDICESGRCAAAHAAAAGLAATYAETVEANVLAEIRERQAAMDRQAIEDRSTLNALRKQITRWTSEVSAIRVARQNAREVIKARVASMSAAAVPVAVGRSRLDLIPLGSADIPVLAPLRLLAEQPISRQDDNVLSRALELVKDIERIRGDLGDKWSCDRRCGGIHKTLAEAVSRAPAIQRDLDRLKPAPARRIESFDLLIDPAYRLESYLSTGSWPTDLLDPSLTANACIRASDLAFPAKAVESAAKFAKSAAEEVRAADVVTTLQQMDLEVLRKASGLKVRISPLAAAGLSSVWEVLKFIERSFLEDLSGLGESSARSIEQAALRLRDAVRDETPVRIDVKKRDKRTARLLEALREWDLSRRDDPTIDEQALARAFMTLGQATTAPKQVLVIAKSRSDSPDVVGLERDHLNRRFPELESGIWEDFLARPAEYFGMLSELGFVTEDEKKMHGDLPEEIIEAVRAKELKREFLTAKLRAYQSFGARFVLVQKKAVIGDEMGLGKTVEALAVMAHLRTTGQTHFIVVCPAAVVSNWMRETSAHTKLRAHRLQGNQWERAAAAKAWVRNGGVAVVTYDLLAWARPFVRQADLGCAVLDEAHYIKNPSAKRSLEAQDLMDAVSYVMLMTGTPLENSVQEFRNIIGYIRPALADSAPDYLPSKFRKHVAPAYLRRNQEDVLTELPELVEVEDWLPMSKVDEKEYRSAVEGGSFMLMRRVAMLSSDSAKLNRLVEIVTEAEANDRRVIVFSYFREVLDAVDKAIPGKVFGPLTGSVPAAQRQVLVDQFSRAAGGAVLVAQIGAGGVGLNIQSASVVVICEPQLKPTTEAQAIARAHRMGQTTTVQVHRLLTEDSVDERIREILAEKRTLFDNFARDSVIAKTAPDAVDVSDSELARLVVAAERERLIGTA